ncbi:serine O-acetyltransferase [Jannaschia faecimaris]|uniref:Serine acetyltransferase n=1 Tax=Jannaschia faecimaris TaxID=1244108 RepID=A0A1H3S8A3_9RHOB|nr:serine O-acetyltransferase [Jannaschia faecimaris]SDZ33950.1 serine O-acetyltransferase [Jannaschia faecimaris]
MQTQLSAYIEDPVTQAWAIIRSEAEAVAKDEPFLAGILGRVFFQRESLQDALSRHLADLLLPRDMDGDALAAILSDAMEADPSIAASAARDLCAVFERDPACTTRAHALLNYRGFQALQAHRIAHRFWNDGRSALAFWLSNRTSLVLGPDIHPAARIGTGIMLDHGLGVVIGETAVVEDDVSILQNVTLGGTGKIHGDRHPKVRRGVMIGAGAKVIGNIEIGEFSKIAAGSVVLRDVPDRSTVAGVPARVVRRHDTTEMPSETMDQSC